MNQSKMVKKMIEDVKKGMIITILSAGALFNQPQHALAIQLPSSANETFTKMEGSLMSANKQNIQSIIDNHQEKLSKREFKLQEAERAAAALTYSQLLEADQREMAFYSNMYLQPKTTLVSNTFPAPFSKNSFASAEEREKAFCESGSIEELWAKGFVPDDSDPNHTLEELKASIKLKMCKINLV